jgi:hypothetical protein
LYQSIVLAANRFQQIDDCFTPQESGMSTHTNSIDQAARLARRAQYPQ